jgi:transposase
MSKTFRPWTPEQTLLLPPSPVDWLPKNHLVFFLLDLAAELDLGEIHAYYRQKDPRGEKAYDPRMMVVLLLYAYCVGLPSSRKIEKACWEDAAFRVLTGNQQPDHSRIRDFRRRHLDALAGLFVQVLRLCQKAGLVSLGHVALEGTKLKANASKHKAMSHERMLKSERQLDGEMRALLRKAEIIDAQEDGQYGKGKWGDELPQELQRRSSRLEWIRKAKAELEAGAAAAKAAQRQEQVEAAEQEAAKPESNGDAERGKRASGRARGARKRADDAQKLAIEKAEAARVEPLIAMDDAPAARSTAKPIAGESPQRSGCPRPDGPQAQVQGRSGDLRAAQDDRGAGVRPDKSRTRPGSLPVTRPGEGERGMEPDGNHPQHPQVVQSSDLSGLSGDRS